MKSLEKIIRNIALTGTLAATTLISSCGGSSGGSGGSGGTPPINPNAPQVQIIPEQQINEGETLSVDLASYITEPNGSTYTITQTNGPGSITGTIHDYQDQKDNDKNNDKHSIDFTVTNAEGLTTTGTFEIEQQDNHYRIPPTFFDTKENWIAFAPTNFDPNQGIFPTEQSLQQDLNLLAQTNFKGVFTYGSDGTLNKVPQLAKNAGMTHVLMGIWDLKSQEEWNNALAEKDNVDGYIVGNEGLGSRYTIGELEDVIEKLRYATDKPVTTTDIIGQYTSPELMAVGDWIFPNDHPYWGGITDPKQAAAYIVQSQQNMANQTSLPVIIKEAGMPSAGDPGVSEANQNIFFRELEKLTQNETGTTFTYFEAFDQPWKVAAPVEPHWGYFKSDRTPKTAAQPGIAYTKVPPKGSTQNLEGKTINIQLPTTDKVSTYIKVGSTWWMKPYWATPLTTIKPDGTWITDITTGGNDPWATAINSSLVDPSFAPVRNTLPKLSNPKVHYQISVTR